MQPFGAFGQPASGSSFPGVPTPPQAPAQFGAPSSLPPQSFGITTSGQSVAPAFGQAQSSPAFGWPGGHGGGAGHQAPVFGQQPAAQPPQQAQQQAQLFGAHDGQGQRVQQPAPIQAAFGQSPMPSPAFGQPQPATQPPTAPSPLPLFGAAQQAQQQHQQLSGFPPLSQAVTPSFGTGQPALQAQQAGFGATPPGFGAAQPPQQPATLFGKPVAPVPGPFPQASPAFGAQGQHGQQAAAGIGGSGISAMVPGGFGAAGPTASAMPAAPRFDFGAAVRKKASQPTPIPEFDGRGDEVAEEEEGRAAFDYEAEKRKALAGLPKFAGTGGEEPAAKPPPSRNAGGSRRSPSPVPGARELDAAEQARRAQRAARFTAGAAAERPPSASGGAMRRVPSSAQIWGPEDGVAMEAAGEEGEEGERGGGRSGAIVGTCEDMCPEEERVRRQNMNDIQIFERDPVNPGATSAALAVKRFARTVDDPSPSQFRTRAALRRTMAHLRGILDRGDVRLGLVHKFLWDRYRSVRQDLYIQGIQDEFGVRIFEEVVRFHILSEHELCQEDQSVTDMEGFNSHLNMEQMNKALISLNDMYSKLAAAGEPIDTEPEFRAYHLLSLMSQHGKFKGDQQVFLSTIKGLRPEVRGAPPVQWVLSLQQAFASNNCVRFFGLVRQAPYLLACLAHTYFPQMRRRALRMLSETLSPATTRPAQVDLSWLQDMFMMDSPEEAADLCTAYGFDVAREGDTLCAVLVKGRFQEPDSPHPRTRSLAISSTAPGSRSTAVTTPALPPMAPEEAAALQARRQEQLRQQQEAAARARQAAEAQAQAQQRAAAEAADAARRAALQQEEQRRREEAERQLALQRQAEAQRAQQLAAQRAQQEAEARLLQEAEARRRAEEEEQRKREEERQKWAAEQARQAAEAQRAQQEAAWREHQAREAERRRREEEERQRVLEEQRKLEEKRQRRTAKRRQAVARLFLLRWRREARERREERERQRRMRAALKSCRVGWAAHRASPLPARASDDAPTPQPGSPEPPAGTQRAQQGASPEDHGGIDLPPLVAPFLLRSNPSASALFWKVAVLGAPAQRAQPAQQRAAPAAGEGQLSVLSRWLGLQLSRGRHVGGGGGGSTYLEGPLPLNVLPTHGQENGGKGRVGRGPAPAATLSTCVAFTPSTAQLPSAAQQAQQGLSAAVLAGAGGLIAPVAHPEHYPPSDPASSALARLLQARPPASPQLPPLLLVAPTHAAAAQWRELVAAQQGGAGGVRVISVQPALADVAQPPGDSSHSAQRGADRPPPAAAPAAVFSRQQLVQGLRWLAAGSPPQPQLEVLSLETAVRGGLQQLLRPLHSDPRATQADYVAVYNTLLDLFAQAIRAAHISPAATWRWPPPELAGPPLASWHTPTTCDHLLSSLEAVHISSDQLPRAGNQGAAQSTAMTLYHRLGALDRLAPPLTLPLEVNQALADRLKQAAAAAASAVLRRSLQPAVPLAASAGPSRRSWRDAVVEGRRSSAEAQESAQHEAPIVAASGGMHGAEGGASTLKRKWGLAESVEAAAADGSHRAQGLMAKRAAKPPLEGTARRHAEHAEHVEVVQAGAAPGRQQPGGVLGALLAKVDEEKRAQQALSQQARGLTHELGAAATVAQPKGDGVHTGLGTNDGWQARRAEHAQGSGGRGSPSPLAGNGELHIGEEAGGAPYHLLRAMPEPPRSPSPEGDGSDGGAGTQHRTGGLQELQARLAAEKEADACLQGQLRHVKVLW